MDDYEQLLLELSYEIHLKAMWIDWFEGRTMPDPWNYSLEDFTQDLDRHDDIKELHQKQQAIYEVNEIGRLEQDIAIYQMQNDILQYMQSQLFEARLNIDYVEKLHDYFMEQPQGAYFAKVKAVKEAFIDGQLDINHILNTLDEVHNMEILPPGQGHNDMRGDVKDLNIGRLAEDNTAYMATPLFNPKEPGRASKTIER